MTGYDWYTLRDLPTPLGSNGRPMYENLGKEHNRENVEVTYPQVIHVICLDSHNTSFFYKRENGTYYWHHSRKNRDDVFIDADQVQLDMFGDPYLSKEFIMKAIL